MDAWLRPAVDWINSMIGNQVLVYLLLGVGLYFTLRLGVVQVRALPYSLRIIFRNGAKTGGITGFQAFATGMASRVGTGNIAGVAVALTVGGPGAIFWMWITALLGMATAFVEATLAQIFKVAHPKDNSFRGGPAYYIRMGLGAPVLSMIFALALTMTFGLVFNATQANAISDAFFHAFALPKGMVGIVLVLLTAPIIFGGVRRVARLAQLLVPLMALAYLSLVFYVMAVHLSEIPHVLAVIFRSAFGLEPAVGGLVGYAISQAMAVGIRRGLYSNEAGMGSAPNAAAIATTPHPVNQGLLQMLGAFMDTVIICTATAMMILLSGQYFPGVGMEGAVLTQRAVTSQVGPWGSAVMAIIIFFFAFSSIIGNYAYAEGSIGLLSRRPLVLLGFRLSVLGMVMFGSVSHLPLVWDMADASMSLMALINLVAISMLGRYAILAWRDYRMQLRQGITHPKFTRDTIPELTKKLPDNVW